MAISSAVDVSAVARVVGIKTQFINTNVGGVVFLPQRIAVVGQGATAATYSTDKFTVSSAQEAGVLYAGTKPPAVFVSRDAGDTWLELESFRQMRRRFWYTPAEPGAPYVLGLTVSPTEPTVILAGIEYGAVLRSDGEVPAARQERRLS